MKILYVVPEGEDMGGIITASEQFMQGFKEAGYAPTFCLLRATKNNGDNSHLAQGKLGWIYSDHTHMHVHPVYGWCGPYLSMVAGVQDFIKLANKHDVVVWAAMFGLRNKLTEGQTSWTQMFTKVKVPHIAQIRDDHIRDRYLWAAALEPHIAGWACVHKMGFDLCEGLRSPRAVIYSCHDVSILKYGLKREISIFSCQTFKRWKKADKLIAAVPYLTERKIKVHLAGDGIELRYMRSKDKCRDAYFCTKDNDPDAPKARLGKKLWDNAIAAGMDYMGPVDEARRNAQMLKSMFFIDLSTRKESTGWINRTAIEAIRCGAIPLLVHQTTSGDEDLSVNGDIVSVMKDYLPVRSDIAPKMLAANIASFFGKIDQAGMRASAQKAIQKFDRKIAAQQLVDLAKGKKAGWHYAKPTPSRALITQAKAEFEEIFGGTL